MFNIVREPSVRRVRKIANRWFGTAMTIREYLRDRDSFNLANIQAMSSALDAVCVALKFPPAARGARQTVANRIIGLARHGEKDPARLRDRVLSEANGWKKPESRTEREPPARGPA